MHLDNAIDERLLLALRPLANSFPTLSIVDGKHLAVVLRIKVLWRLNCCALSIGGVEEWEHRASLWAYRIAATRRPIVDALTFRLASCRKKCNPL